MQKSPRDHNVSRAFVPPCQRGYVGAGPPSRTRPVSDDSGTLGRHELSQRPPIRQMINRPKFAGASSTPAQSGTTRLSRQLILDDATQPLLPQAPRVWVVDT